MDSILDLRHPYNRQALRRINWKAVKALRRGDTFSWRAVDSLFLKAVCTPEFCPIGWHKCKRRSYSRCYYYDLLKTVEAIRREISTERGKSI